MSGIGKTTTTQDLSVSSSTSVSQGDKAQVVQSSEKNVTGSLTAAVNTPVEKNRHTRITDSKTVTSENQAPFGSAFVSSRAAARNTEPPRTYPRAKEAAKKGRSVTVDAKGHSNISGVDGLHTGEKKEFNTSLPTKKP